jgi:hypothetical protein
LQIARRFRAKIILEINGYDQATITAASANHRDLASRVPAGNASGAAKVDLG